jgi:type I restriction enzyme S subunit
MEGGLTTPTSSHRNWTSKGGHVTFFNSAFGKQLVLGKIVGAAQKHFNITAAKEVMLHVPPMSEQFAIVAKSDELREETQSLSRIYERKLAALEELKKSLLHQAFNGEL